MRSRPLLAALALCFMTAPAIAEDGKRPRRRVERHDAQQTRVHRIQTVIVVGRRQLPQASIELTVQRPTFSVGTARYSERDRRFLRPGERW